MATPAAYARMRDAQRKSAAEAAREGTAKRKRWEDEEQELFETIVKALKPYHRADLDGDKTTIKMRPSQREVEVFVNGELLTKISVYRHFSSCNCDGPCNCRVDTCATTNMEPHLWFSGDWRNENALAAAMQRGIKEHHERKQWAEIRRSL